MEENNVIICENCYEENEITRDTCKNCGEKLYKNNIEKNVKENTKINKKNVNKVKETRNYKEEYHYITQNNNKTATAVKLIGCLEIICGFILGIVLGDIFETGYYYKEFNTGLCIGCIVAGFITGIFILGFGEIIQKLQNIEDNTRK